MTAVGPHIVLQSLRGEPTSGGQRGVLVTSCQSVAIAAIAEAKNKIEFPAIGVTGRMLRIVVYTASICSPSLSLILTLSKKETPGTTTAQKEQIEKITKRIDGHRGKEGLVTGYTEVRHEEGAVVPGDSRTVDVTFVGSIADGISIPEDKIEDYLVYQI